MSIKVKYFANVREKIGHAGDDIDFVPGLTVSKIWAKVTDGEELPESLMVAVNMEYVKGDPEVNDGDEVAFFPSVTGG